VVAEHDDERRTREQRLADELQRAYADALLAGSPSVAEAVVREAIEAGLGQATIDDLVIAPALRVIGDLWADGRLSIAEEHAATSISLRVISLQREAFRTARQRSSLRVLLAGAQDERHVVGLEMAASLILAAGYDVRLLGADLPVGQIGHAIDQHSPTVIGFTTASSLSAVNMPAAFAAVRARDHDVGLLVGGRGVEECWAATWNVVICRHVADAVADVDALAQRAHRN
jgi:MerR family transcriptional regulator, light-induced transcriptional regulator